jgi:hypothetical protein
VIAVTRSDGCQALPPLRPGTAHLIRPIASLHFVWDTVGRREVSPSTCSGARGRGHGVRGQACYLLPPMRQRHALILVLMTSLLSPGCRMLASSATTRLAASVSAAVLDQNDALLVRDGAPAYLIAIDGLIEGDPKNETLLLTGARLYSAYASAFVEDPERASRLTNRAHGYGNRAICERSKELCAASKGNFDGFVAALQGTRSKDLPALYGYGSVWAGWVQVNSADWNAIADLPKVQAVMERVVELDDGYEEGGAHLYLGLLYTLRPASLGGKPELGRKHFERSIELSGGRNLMAKVFFASQYARLVFDRPLHDALLHQVLEADPNARGYTLTNTLAQEQAEVLLADADEYF